MPTLSDKMGFKYLAELVAPFKVLNFFKKQAKPMLCHTLLCHIVVLKLKAREC